ncbi:MAG: peptidylprolyl isomerase [Pirellulaceae bacterium]|nr:peptidylprolyl isomerase [Pirellulaceae bacterium]
MPSPSSQAQQLKVLAVVNGQQVSRQQLAQECLRRYGSDVLETIINRYVISQACQQRGIQVSQQDVDEEIKQLAGKFGLSVDRWLEMLKTERDLDPEQYRREVVWPTLALRRLAQDKLTVSPQELRQAWESEYGPKIKARLIVANSLEKANQLHARAVANPEQFGQLAKEESDDSTSASVRGMIPPIRMHSGTPEVEQVAFRLQPGEISRVLQVADQYLILQCEQRLPETPIAENFRASAEAQLRERILDDKLRVAATDIFRQLQDEAQVVNVYNSPQLRQQMPGVAATINGQQIPLHQLAEECVRRHGEEVLDGEINRLLLNQELQRRGKSVERADLDAEIQRAADAYGYVRADGTPDVNAWLAEVQKQEGASIELYVDDAVWPTVALKKLVEGHADVEVTQEDLQKGFESNYGERVEALAIVLNNQRQAAKVWELARNRPTDQFFGELAQQYSIEPVSRANFGKVPPIRRHSGQPNLEDEAFALQPGQLSGIIAVGDKYIILRCQGRTQPVVEQFETVKDELFKDIQEKKLRLAMSNEFDRLKELAQIDNFLTGTSQTGKRSGTADVPLGPLPPAASTGRAPTAGPSR